MRGCECCLDTTVVQRKGFILVLSPPTPLIALFKGPKCFNGRRGQGMHLGAPHGHTPVVGRFVECEWVPLGCTSHAGGYH